MIKKSLVTLFGILVFGTFLYYKPVVKNHDCDILLELKKNREIKVEENLSNNEISED